MPYPGQGTPLAQHLGIEGEWIIDGEFFLAVVDGPLSADRAKISHVLEIGGRRVRGLDAEVLASELGISGNDLLSLNRQGEVTVKIVAPLAAGHPATVFLRTPKQILSIELN